jgi:carbonic anhydrase
MDRLLKGYEKFRREVFSKKRELFERLSQNQEPKALFITCSDSRIDPSLLTQTEPGDLFILRNAGNIVPTYGGTLGGITATIEFAVAVLNVPDVIVCGHTDCGVMKAILNPKSVESLPAVKNWMGQAEATRRIIHDHFAHHRGRALLMKTTQENVRVQLANLKTHPSIATKLRRGEVTLHGWVYSIPTGEIWTFDEAKDDFVSLAVKARRR